jgi:hypothetical protein
MRELMTVHPPDAIYADCALLLGGRTLDHTAAICAAPPPPYQRKRGMKAMHMQLDSTDEIVLIDGVRCRKWVGYTAKGNAVVAYVHRVRAEVGSEAEAELDAALMLMSEPRSLEGGR